MNRDTKITCSQGVCSQGVCPPVLTKNNGIEVKGDEFNIGLDGSDLQFSFYYNF